MRDRRVPLDRLGVAQAAGLVDLLPGQAEVRDRRFNVSGRNNTWLATPSYLSAFLRSVVLISKPTLGERFDLKRVGLSAVRRSDQFVVRALRLRELHRKIRRTAWCRWPRGR